MVQASTGKLPVDEFRQEFDEQAHHLYSCGHNRAEVKRQLIEFAQHAICFGDLFDMFVEHELERFKVTY